MFAYCVLMDLHQASDQIFKKIRYKLNLVLFCVFSGVGLTVVVVITTVIAGRATL